MYTHTHVHIRTHLQTRSETNVLTHKHSHSHVWQWSSSAGQRCLGRKRKIYSKNKVNLKQTKHKQLQIAISAATYHFNISRNVCYCFLKEASLISARRDSVNIQLERVSHNGSQGNAVLRSLPSWSAPFIDLIVSHRCQRPETAFTNTSPLVLRIAVAKCCISNDFV